MLLALEFEVDGAVEGFVALAAEKDEIVVGVVWVVCEEDDVVGFEGVGGCDQAGWSGRIDDAMTS